MTINNARENISEWDLIRHTDQGYELINSGSVIELTRSQYNEMNIINSDALHLYLGAERDDINNHTMIFHMLGNEYDVPQAQGKVPEHLINLYFKQPPYFIVAPGFESEIEPLEAWRRAFKWTLFSYDWFEKKRDEGKTVRAFKIPLQAIKTIFDSGSEGVLLFFGIRFFSTDMGSDFNNSYEIDLIATESTTQPFKLPQIYNNLTTPCPPYSCGDFHLISEV